MLSILRKILTIAMLDRTWKRLEEKIPKSQAAYQRGRGTTEQVLALKILIEKAITSCDYDLHILLLDMSKAFDTVRRKMLLNDLIHIRHWNGFWPANIYSEPLGLAMAGV